MTAPEDFALLLRDNPRAKTKFDRFSASERFSICYQIQDPKRPETLERRLEG